jgi:hypothetical protein
MKGRDFVEYFGHVAAASGGVVAGWVIFGVLGPQLDLLFVEEFGRVDPADVILILPESSLLTLADQGGFARCNADPFGPVVGHPVAEYGGLGQQFEQRPPQRFPRPADAFRNQNRFLGLGSQCYQVTDFLELLPGDQHVNLLGFRIEEVNGLARVFLDEVSCCSVSSRLIGLLCLPGRSRGEQRGTALTLFSLYLPLSSAVKENRGGTPNTPHSPGIARPA